MYCYNKLYWPIWGAVRPKYYKPGILPAQAPCCNLLPLLCFSELDRPLKDSAWTRHCWEWDITAEAQVFLLGPEHWLTRPSAVELTVRAGSRRNTGRHTSCHTGQGLWICWHSVSHSVWRPQWEQTSTGIPRVSSTSTYCFISSSFNHSSRVTCCRQHSIALPTQWHFKWQKHFLNIFLAKRRWNIRAVDVNVTVHCDKISYNKTNYMH
jgi:hypothetical protein